MRGVVSVFQQEGVNLQPLIVCQNLCFRYDHHTESAPLALSNVDLEIAPSEFVAIVGHNGSGKSTLAKCLCGILHPTEGVVRVSGMDTRDQDQLHHIRATVSLVMQNPDDQFIATTVAEEVAFGPENLGVPHPELGRRVERALIMTGLAALTEANPRYLSAGQKARLALADMLAIEPRCLIIDETTAMLDPVARTQILDLLQELNHSGIAILLITHQMEEASLAQRIVIMSSGEIALQGPPDQVFLSEDLARLSMQPPFVVELAQRLRARGLDIPSEIIHPQSLATHLIGRSIS